jgi:hypothetical protein
MTPVGEILQEHERLFKQLECAGTTPGMGNNGLARQEAEKYKASGGL